MSFSFIKKHAFLVTVITIAVLVVAGIAARAAHKQPATQTSDTGTAPVQLIAVKDYSQNSHQVTANGTVESLQEVDLKSQVSGKVTQLNVAVGSHVTQGQVLVSLDPGTSAAALTSAQGQLQQAQANYNKLLAGSSAEAVNAAQVAVTNATTNLNTTQTQQNTAVQNAYTALLNTTISAIPAGSNFDSIVPVISGTYTGTQEGSYHISLYQTGSGLKFQVSGLESAMGDVKTEPVALGSMGLLIQFSAIPSPGDTWTITIPNTYAPQYTANNNAYQATVQGRDAAISTAQSQLNSAQAALAQVQATARPADIQAAQAAITSAQGQVQAAEVGYRNTTITAPFSGTVSALPVKLSDVVSPGEVVVSVVNESGLQVKVFVSNTDLPFIAQNDIARIGSNNATGTVTNIAPSVNATTKTGEVDIAIADPTTANLTVGQNISVTISGSAGSSTASGYLLPLQAVKITPDNKAYVYTVSQNVAKQHEVTITTVDGEHVQVTSGLDDTDQIVSNAYGVSDGDTVQLQ